MNFTHLMHGLKSIPHRSFPPPGLPCASIRATALLLLPSHSVTGSPVAAVAKSV